MEAAMRWLIVSCRRGRDGFRQELGIRLSVRLLFDVGGDACAAQRKGSGETAKTTVAAVAQNASPLPALRPSLFRPPFCPMCTSSMSRISESFS